MNDKELGWVAGIIDGEGSIGLSRKSYKNGGYNWKPTVAINNTKKEIVDKIMHIAKVGHIYSANHSKYNRKSKVIFWVKLRNEEIRIFLPKVMHILVEKKKHARLILEFLWLHYDVPPSPYRNMRMESIYWELKLLNARGGDGRNDIEKQIETLGVVFYSRNQFIKDSRTCFEEPLMDVSEENWLGWVAGIIDGEGNLGFSKIKRVKGWIAKRGFVWAPKIQIDMTSKSVLERFMGVVDAGHIQFLGKRKRERKELYRVTLKHDEILSLLWKIKDILIKRPNAEFLIEAIELIKEYESRGKRDPITKVRDKRLETIYWKLRLLNARGIHGEEEVRSEMSEVGFLPYSREEFDRDVKTAIEEMRRRGYEANLKRARAWKAKHRDQMHEYWHRWHEGKKKDEEYMEKRREKAKERSARVRGTPEHQEYMRRWRAKNRGRIREHNKRNWQETKARLETDPEFAEAYRKEINERARRSREKRIMGTESAQVDQGRPAPSAQQSQGTPRPTSG